MTSTRWLLGAALTATVLTGCGGSDPLEQAELADRANTICAKYAQRARDLGRPDLADAQIAAQYFSDAAELAERQQGELEALEPAEDLRSDYDALTAATQKAIVLLSDLAEASEQEDDARRTELIDQLPDLRTEVDDAADAVGAEECAD